MTPAPWPLSFLVSRTMPMMNPMIGNNTAVM